MFCDQCDFLVRIGCVPVESHDHFLAEAFHVLDMFVQILETVFHPFDILFLDLVFRYASMQLQALGCRHDNCQFRCQSGFAAFDVEELFSS